MAKPTTRETFIDNCKRRLGWPVIDLNLDDDQIEDRVDEALDYYYQFHNEGTFINYLSHQITSDDKTNKYISLNEEIIGVKRIFPLTGTTQAGGMFDIRYQWRLNDLHSFTSAQASNYVITQQHLQMLNMIFSGQVPIRFNRHMDRLFIDWDWDNDVAVGEYIIAEVWQMVDPDTYTDMYSDRMLQRYCTQLMKQQWGTNMKKFQGVQLIGGVEMNGQTIYDEATADIEKLELQMRDEYELPPMMEMG